VTPVSVAPNARRPWQNVQVPALRQLAARTLPGSTGSTGSTGAFGVPRGSISQVLRERAEHWRRPGVLATAGCAASTALVLGASRAPVPVGMRLPSSFAGLLNPSRGSGTASAVVVVLALGVLVLCWWQLLRAVTADQLGLRTVLCLAAIWAAPLLLAPPLLSLDAYAYLAQGEMVARGLDPYTAGPVLLGADPVVDRVDPMWRGSPAPYGPVVLVLLRAVAVSTDQLAAGVLLLRLLALLGVAVAIAAAVALTRARSRALVLALTAANPVTLVHLVGGAHIDALLAGAVGLALLALHGRRPWTALLLAALASAVKITALPLVILVLVVLARDPQARRQLPLRGTALVGLPFLLTLPVVSAPWGFLDALRVPGSNSPWYAPASVVGRMLHLLATLGGLSPSPAVTANAGRVLVLLVGGAWVLHQLRVTWRDRAEDAPMRDVRRAGLVLLVVAVALPAVYGWYLAAGLFTVAATGSRRTRWVLVVLSSGLAFSSMPPLYGARVWYLVGAWAVVVTGLLVAARSTARTRAARSIEPTPAHTDGSLRDRVPDRFQHLTLRLVRVAGLSLVPAIGIGLAANSAQAEPAQLLEAQSVANVARTVSATYPGYHLVRIVRSDGPADFTVDMVMPSQDLCRLQLRFVASADTAQRLPGPLTKPVVPFIAPRSCPVRLFVSEAKPVPAPVDTSPTGLPALLPLPRAGAGAPFAG